MAFWVGTVMNVNACYPIRLRPTAHSMLLVSDSESCESETETETETETPESSVAETGSCWSLLLRVMP